MTSLVEAWSLSVLVRFTSTWLLFRKTAEASSAVESVTGVNGPSESLEGSDHITDSADEWPDTLRFGLEFDEERRWGCRRLYRSCSFRKRGPVGVDTRRRREAGRGKSGSSVDIAVIAGIETLLGQRSEGMVG